MRKKIAIVLIVLAMYCMCTGCNQISEGYEKPQQVVQMTVQAYQNQDIEKLSICYQMERKKIIKNQDIFFEAKFFQALGAKKIVINGTEELLKKSSYSYIGISYDFVESSGERIPYYEYFLVLKKKNIAHVLTEDDYPDDMIQQIHEDQKKYKETKLYAKYEKRKNVYEKKHEKYADSIYTQLQNKLDETHIFNRDIQNMWYLCIVCAIGSVQLLLLLVVISIHRSLHLKKVGKGNRGRKGR